MAAPADQNVGHPKAQHKPVGGGRHSGYALGFEAGSALTNGRACYNNWLHCLTIQKSVTESVNGEHERIKKWIYILICCI